MLHIVLSENYHRRGRPREQAWCRVPNVHRTAHRISAIILGVSILGFIFISEEGCELASWIVHGQTGRWFEKLPERVCILLKGHSRLKDAGRYASATSLVSTLAPERHAQVRFLHALLPMGPWSWTSHSDKMSEINIACAYVTQTLNSRSTRQHFPVKRCRLVMPLSILSRVTVVDGFPSYEYQCHDVREKPDILIEPVPGCGHSAVTLAGGL
jgi:hypothetical protein